MVKMGKNEKYLQWCGCNFSNKKSYKYLYKILCLIKEKTKTIKLYKVLNEYCTKAKKV